LKVVGEIFGHLMGDELVGPGEKSDRVGIVGLVYRGEF